MKVGDLVEIKGSGRMGIITDITFNVYRHMIIHIMYVGTGNTFPHYTHDVIILKEK